MLAFGEARVPELLVDSRATCAFTASCMAALEREEQRRVERRGEHLHASEREAHRRGERRGERLHASEREGRLVHSWPFTPRSTREEQRRVYLKPTAKEWPGSESSDCRSHLPRAAIRGHQTQSDVIRGHQTQSEVIRGHQRSIRGHQRPSEVIVYTHHASGGTPSESEQCAPQSFTSAWTRGGSGTVPLTIASE